MASGKSTVGRLVAERLGFTFVDLDAAIEKRTGESVASFFDRGEEARFRGLEAAVLRELTLSRDIVVATGGGVVELEENRSTLARDWFAVFLDVPLEVVKRRLARARAGARRPLAARGDAFLEALYARRAPLYAEACSLRVDAGEKTVNEVVAEIVARIEERGHRA